MINVNNVENVVNKIKSTIINLFKTRVRVCPPSMFGFEDSQIAGRLRPNAVAG